MEKLPSMEEFKANVKFEEDDMKAYWNKSLFKCPRCNGGVKRDYSVAYMTNPPKYRYFCKDCGWYSIM